MPSFGSNRLHHSTLRSSPSTRFYCKIRTYTDLCTNLHCACSACWTLAKPQERAESVLQDCQQSRQPAATLSRCTNSQDVVRNPGITSPATNIGVPTVWRIGSIV